MIPDSFAKRHMLAVLFEAQGGKCGICQRHMPPTSTARDQRNPMRPTVEHVIPQASGGFDGRGNLMAAHSRCNSQKGQRFPNAAELAALRQINAAMGWTNPNPMESMDFGGIAQPGAVATPSPKSDRLTP